MARGFSGKITFGGARLPKSRLCLGSGVSSHFSKDSPQLTGDSPLIPSEGLEGTGSGRLFRSRRGTRWYGSGLGRPSGKLQSPPGSNTSSLGGMGMAEALDLRQDAREHLGAWSTASCSVNARECCWGRGLHTEVPTCGHPGAQPAQGASQARHPDSPAGWPC